MAWKTYGLLGCAWTWRVTTATMASHAQLGVAACGERCALGGGCLTVCRDKNGSRRLVWRLRAKRRQVLRRERQVWNRSLAVVCEGAAPSIIVVLVIITDLLELLEVELVTQDATDATEALDELVALG